VKDLSPDLLVPLVPIGQAARGQVPIAFGASPDEALWLTAPKRATGRAAVPKGAAVYMHALRFGAEVVTRQYAEARLPHFIQRTKGGLLFVKARQPDDEPNAWVTNDAGRVVRWLSLGDGLSDVRVSPRGKIWTAYFDEGVFGSGAGAAGLVARDAAGRRVWAYDARKAGTDDIADVYAFNLADEDDAWVYFYQPFAIVRWQKNRPTTWRTRVEGARAMAVRGSEALLFGDYDDPTALRILALPKGGGSARVKRRLRLRLPRRTDIKSVHALGSAHRLIVWSDQHLMVLESW
jgi:hypothetical protein